MYNKTQVVYDYSFRAINHYNIFRYTNLCVTVKKKKENYFVVSLHVCVCQDMWKQPKSQQGCPQWPFKIVCDVDPVVELRSADEAGAVVKKLSSLSLRCSGSCSLTLASPMSLLMAEIRASIQKDRKADETRQYSHACVCVFEFEGMTYQESRRFSLDVCSPP